MRGVYYKILLGSLFTALFCLFCTKSPFLKVAYASTLFSDDFNRPDENTLGPNWVQFHGARNAGIGDNQAYITTGSGGNWGFFKISDLNIQDQDVSVTFIHQNGDTSVLARVIDINNRIVVNYYKNEGLQVYEIYQGNYRSIANTAPNAVVGATYSIRVSAIGNTLRVWVNGADYVNATLNHITSGSAGFGANDGYTNVIFDDFTVTGGSVPTPSLIPTPLPTPTPIPVSKVILVPGLGASWNADALLNCKASGYSGDWTLAPYAKEIYEPLLSVLNDSGWNAKPFYYDWRQDIRNNASLFSNYINENSSAEEKINVVGHSMGGLVSRAYLEDQEGGKISSLLTVGSPHQGAVQSYPAWSGGEVWNDNLFTKIAITLYLKRCGGVLSSDKKTIQTQISSIQNLLPTFNYLKDKTGNYKPVSNMSAKNNWLPTSFSSPFWGVRFGTLSGNGFPTLSAINVTSPSRNDTRNGLWIDGKSSGKEYINEGDGTVLLTSSQVDGAQDNTVINQSHSGLMASSEGMTEILKFLGAPSLVGNFNLVRPALAADAPDQSIYMEPSSALIIVGYPGNFWVTDGSGNVIHDDNGMISLTNPTSGNYKLDIVPQSNKTLFIVAQFLANGQVLYKEYTFTNLQPKSKIIDFDAEHPTKDIIKDKIIHKRPASRFRIWRLPKYFNIPHFWKWPVKK